MKRGMKFPINTKILTELLHGFRGERSSFIAINDCRNTILWNNFLERIFTMVLAFLVEHGNASTHFKNLSTITSRYLSLPTGGMCVKSICNDCNGASGSGRSSCLEVFLGRLVCVQITQVSNIQATTLFTSAVQY